MATETPPKPTSRAGVVALRASGLAPPGTRREPKALGTEAELLNNHPTVSAWPSRAVCTRVSSTERHFALARIRRCGCRRRRALV